MTFWGSKSILLGTQKCQNDIFQGSLGPKISKQSQNSQKMSKSHPKSDQKWSKKDQKVVKSPFGNDILGVKKAYFWVSKSVKKGIFEGPQGSKNHRQSQNR